MLAIGFALCVGPLSIDAQSESPPNIIIIFTDDHGWADLGANGVREDIKTPNTDSLAQSGVRFTSGYSSAPQCRPSRAGLMSGRNQSLFGLEDNSANSYPWGEYTIAERLRDAGYQTGISGKWHLQGQVDSTGKLPDGSDASPEQIAAGIKYGQGAANPGNPHHHGFTELFSGLTKNYTATHAADGTDLGGLVDIVDRRYRLEIQAEWGVNFIKRQAQAQKPFFLYLSFYAPHVPLEAPKKYLDRFPGEMPERRRLALAMISAVDDGVGLVTSTLEELGIRDNTLIFYIGDNGAPLKIHKVDAPGGGPGWDGSLNEPWIGEKGMISEGGIRVPFVASWPNSIPANQVYEHPVIAFDATATSIVAAGLELDERIDGANLIPHLDGTIEEAPHDALCWRWSGQSAIRMDKWKYLHAGGREYLFDLSTKAHESENLIHRHPERAALMKHKLIVWAQSLQDPGIDKNFGYQGPRYYDHYLDGKIETKVPAPKRKRQ